MYTYIYIYMYIYICLCLCKPWTQHPLAEKCINRGSRKNRKRCYALQYSLMAMRHAAESKMHSWNLVSFSKRERAVLYTSEAHSSLGIPRLFTLSALFKLKSSSNTSCRAGHVAGRRASLPKYPSCCSRSRQLSGVASSCCSTLALDTLLQ